MCFKKNVILKNDNSKVTVVNDIKTNTYSIGITERGRNPKVKHISKELYNKLLEELLNQDEFK